MKLVKTKKIKINEDTNIAELILDYPQLVDVLLNEFGFHCANCIFSGMDTLKQGALIHGIKGEEFKIMIKRIESVVNNPESYTVID